MRKSIYTATAENNKAMTTRELRKFIASIEGANDTADVKVRISFGGGIKSITVTDEDEGE